MRRILCAVERGRGWSVGRRRRAVEVAGADRGLHAPAVGRRRAALAVGRRPGLFRLDQRAAGPPDQQHLAARHDLRRHRAARERLRAALVTRRQVDRLFRPHRGGQRPDRRRPPRRGAAPDRADRQHQPSAAFVGRARGVVAGWPLPGLPVRHRGSGDRQRQRRPDGDHALPVQAHRRGRADALQRQQAPAHLRGGRGLARGPPADERPATTSTPSTGRRRAIRFCSSRTAKPTPTRCSTTTSSR